MQETKTATHPFDTLAACNAYAAALRCMVEEGTIFDDTHVHVVALSLVRALAGERVPRDALPQTQGLDLQRLESFLRKRAHLPPKHWPTVKDGIHFLREIVGSPGDARFEKLFSRVVDGGRWNIAARYAEARICNSPGDADKLPWVVLIMGCNGIRKTTSVFQSWFKAAIAFSLGSTYTGRVEDLPDGNNSFFRQLDFMMANFVNVEFERLYKSACCRSMTPSTSSNSEGSVTSEKMVEAYMALKAAIFARYRGLCEMLGGLLLESAAERRMNVMLETSGKDIASFHYVNFFFPDEKYRKMVVYFDIDDIEHAKRSVDERMRREMARGCTLASRVESTPAHLMSVNCGGPYGGKQLRAVEAAARRTWKSVTTSTKDCGGQALGKEDEEGNDWSSWYFARVAISGNSDGGGRGWSARAVGVVDGGESRQSEPFCEFSLPTETPSMGDSTT